MRVPLDPRHVEETVFDALISAREKFGDKEILEDIEGTDVDVDVLAERVKRAAELVKVCRDRIAAAKLHVEQVVADVEDE